MRHASPETHGNPNHLSEQTGVRGLSRTKTPKQGSCFSDILGRDSERLVTWPESVNLRLVKTYIIQKQNYYYILLWLFFVVKSGFQTTKYVLLLLLLLVVTLWGLFIFLDLRHIVLFLFAESVSKKMAPLKIKIWLKIYMFFFPGVFPGPSPPQQPPTWEALSGNLRRNFFPQRCPFCSHAEKVTRKLYPKVGVFSKTHHEKTWKNLPLSQLNLLGNP